MARAMLGENVIGGGGGNRPHLSKEAFAALSKALRGHSEYAAAVVKGNGCDRHLLGLMLIAKELGEEAPEIFSDPAWTRSTRHRLSTSQVRVANRDRELASILFRISTRASIFNNNVIAADKGADGRAASLTGATM